MTDPTATLRRRDFWTRALAVVREWLSHPSQVASVIPSFPSLTRTIAKRDCIRSARQMVDLGPGTGGTTERLLDTARHDCRVLAIEKTSGFIETLNAIGDPRLTVVQDDVVGLERILLMHEMKSPDVIISGIPFSSLDADTAQSAMKAIYRTLGDGGTFIAYQLRGHVAEYARPLFGEPVAVQYVLLNLPPLRIFTWQKPSSHAAP
ncbi:class I SAM-dependent methyltransferase [Aporhodopirellula aestuarii]|uniref:Methyltransferase domain-containing protein n=1 Tax=Aporhodopirellula aestuarii TaxID=2950107 RepID=A0ABT0UBB8_9BACT|nr:rRNA adenine N-6-methyltransferase family protein [Aporhodopirellula aestuarii]MCM2373631.1 methyltransferase domain-containing protein [Aporhodopirellula aestuarii]